MAPVTRNSAARARKAEELARRIHQDPVVVVPTAKAVKKIKPEKKKKLLVKSEDQHLQPYPEPPVVRHPPVRFGLIQELLYRDLFSLLVQTILWNQTRGTQAKPVLYRLLTEFPEPAALAAAPLPYLTDMLYPIGLHNIRAARLIAFANAWLASPPCRERRYRRINYPSKGHGRDIGPSEVLTEDDPRKGWEVAHLPGMGAYALDTFRIFARDRMRGLEDDNGTTKPGTEPEWRRVVPLDKDLRQYMVWKWRKEGFAYDILSGRRVPFTQISTKDKLAEDR